MEIILILSSFIQSFAVSLGVGGSTLAILNFFVAIKDGTIDPTERKMMGIVYVVLRIAMFLIFVSTISLLSFELRLLESIANLSTLMIATCITLSVLILNAILMTAKLMSSTFGPAIQAGSWYTLGGLYTLKSLGIVSFGLELFFLAYITVLVLFIAITNGVMAWMNAHRHGFMK